LGNDVAVAAAAAAAVVAAVAVVASVAAVAPFGTTAGVVLLWLWLQELQKLY
jgi:hypothetical protein